MLLTSSKRIRKSLNGRLLEHLERGGRVVTQLDVLGVQVVVQKVSVGRRFNRGRHFPFDDVTSGFDLVIRNLGKVFVVREKISWRWVVVAQAQFEREENRFVIAHANVTANDVIADVTGWRHQTIDTMLLLLLLRSMDELLGGVVAEKDAVTPGWTP
jgi:hypothetical protein